MKTPSWIWKWTRRMLFTLLGLVTLTALMIAFENWRAKRDWLAYREAWTGKGELFDRMAFMPGDIPDEENLAATPLLAPLRDYDFDPRTGAGVVWTDPDAVARLSRHFGWHAGLKSGGSPFMGAGFADFSIDTDRVRAAASAAANASGTGATAPADGPDSDGDGLTDLQESYLGTDPQKPDQAAAELRRALELAERPELPGGRPEGRLAPLAGLEGRALAEGLLRLLEADRPAFDEIAAAAASRPHLVFNAGRMDPTGPLLAQLSPVKSIAAAFRTRALARLLADDPTGALEDIETALAIGDRLQSEPLLITGLVRLAVAMTVVQPIWEGLARHQWSPEQLARLQRALGRLNLVEEGAFYLRAERAYSLMLFDFMLRRPSELSQVQSDLVPPVGRFLPSAIVYRNELAVARDFQEKLLPLFDPARRTVDMERLRQLTETAEAEAGRLKGGFPPFKVSPYRIFAWMLLPAIQRVPEKFAQGQAWITLAEVACALERHRLEKHDLPGNLEALAPEFLDQAPLDPAGGGPLHYRRLSPTRFILYSVGPGATDNGGEVVRRERDGMALPADPKGDWVWTYPESP